MSIYISQTSCCAVDDIDGLHEMKGKPEKTITGICDNYRNYDRESAKDPSFIFPAFLVFTQVCPTKKPNRSSNDGNLTVYGTYGDELSQYISKQKLGKVIESHRKLNPNSGNTVKVFLWQLSRGALNKWAKAHGVEEEPVLGSHNYSSDFNPYY
jgi:hypothetical protein